MVSSGMYTMMGDIPHVTNGEATKWGVFLEDFDAHGLGWNHPDVGRITGLEELRLVFEILVCAAINFLDELSELASNVSGVAVEDRSIAGANLTRVIEDDNLGFEGFGSLWRVVLGITAHVATTDFLNGDVLHVEANIVAWNTLGKLLVMHFDGLDFLVAVSKLQESDRIEL
jgi:hypothetical protein